MPTLAGWITGKQVPIEDIEQTLSVLIETLQRPGYQPARLVEEGAGILTFTHPQLTNALSEPAVLDWSAERRTLVYKRPLSGLYPLYFILDWPAEGNLLFASEIQALLALGVPRRLNLPALDALRCYGFIPAPWTAFQDIQVVPAGSLLRWQYTKMVLNHSTDYQSDPIDPAEVLEQLRLASSQILSPQILPALHLQDQPSSLLGLLLTARQLSEPATITHLSFSQRSRSPFLQLTENLPELGENPLVTIRGLSNHLDYWATPLAHLATPYADIFPLYWYKSLYMTAQEAETSLILGSLGSKILFAEGISKVPSMRETNILNWYALWLNNAQRTIPFWSEQATRVLTQATPWEETPHARKLARRVERIESLPQRMAYLDLHLRLPDHEVLQAQMLASRLGLQLRSTFLAPHPFRLLSQLRLAQAEDFTLPTELFQQILPEVELSVITRRQATPISEIFQQPDLVASLFSPEALERTGLFDPAKIQELLSRITTRQVPRELIFALTTQLFCQLFEMEINL